MNRVVRASERAAGGRLDVFLAAELGLARSQTQKLLRDGAVTVNGQTERPSYRVQTGDEVKIDQTERSRSATLVTLDLPVVYEDADMLVIDKPAGIAVHGGNGRTGEATVADFARTISSDPDPERPGIVHRLDRDTSGLLVIAKSAAAKDTLQEQWRDKTVAKTYQLLTIGRVEPGEAVIRLPLDRDPAHPTRRHVHPGGREAITRYRTVTSLPGYSYLEAYPETGRTHQLRVHFASLGHPVAGDVVYGPPKRPLGLKRQFLHACRLVLTSPSGKLVDLTSPLPPDLVAALDSLTKQV